MNERELTRIEVEAEHAEDTKTLALVREIRAMREMLQRYLQAHVDAVEAVGSEDLPKASRELWDAYFAAWDLLGLRAPHV
jgi:hypothetical protein